MKVKWRGAMGWIVIVLIAGTALAGPNRGRVKAIREQAAPPRQPAPAPAGSPRVGQFLINNPGGTVEVLLNRRNNTATFDLRGPKLSLTSTRYDIAAPRIQLELDRKRNIVRESTATGGVRIEVREPEEERTTTLTGDTAVYRFAANGKPTRIDITGNVRSVVRSVLTAPGAPFVLEGQSGFVEFLSADETRIVINNFTATGTLKE